MKACIRSIAGERAVPWFRAAAAVLAFLGPAGAGINVKVTGNSFLRDRQIKEVLTPDPESYNKDGILTWQEDAQFYAADLYRRNGFFDAKVDVDIRPREGGGKEDWDALLTIREGERYLYDTVRVVVAEDTSAVDTVKLAPPQTALMVDSSDLEARRGEPYKEELIFQDRRFLLQRYGNSGYVRAKVDDKVTVKPESRTVKVDYLVEPSYPVIFDTLIIRNQRAEPADSLEGITRDKLLRSLVKYDKGDTVRISGTDRLIEKLQYTGAYNYARIKDTLLPGPAHASGLILQLEERVPGNFRTSTFYETYSGFGVSADARHSNFAGSLNEVRGGGALASLRQSVYAGYGSPLVFGYLIRFDDDFSINWYQDQDVHNQGTDSAEGLFAGDFRAVNSARLTWPWSYWLRLVGNAEVEAKSRMLTQDRRERSLNLNFIETAYFAFLNQALDPTRGVRFAPSWGNGGPLIEDNRFRFTEFRHNWLEIQTGYYYYYPPLNQVKIALRLDGGRFFGEGGTNSDRFFLGGGRSVRSYGFRELCPEVEIDEKTKDEVCSTQNQTLAYFLTSYELRIAPFAFGRARTRGPLKHLRPLEFVPFYDFGKVWDTRDGFALSGAESQTRGQGAAMGWGLRYPLLGIFNFRIDFAYGRPGHGKRPDIWIVDLAQAF
ncbi:MAG TPA: POTRA domain-containing protein [Fibrobacteria bacterium]|nr:POTRA domain-containing protein [Fibrobacteria bacterium]